MGRCCQRLRIWHAIHLYQLLISKRNIEFLLDINTFIFDRAQPCNLLLFQATRRSWRHLCHHRTHQAQLQQHILQNFLLTFVFLSNHRTIYSQYRVRIQRQHHLHCHHMYRQRFRHDFRPLCVFVLSGVGKNFNGIHRIQLLHHLPFQVERQQRVLQIYPRKHLRKFLISIQQTFRALCVALCTVRSLELSPLQEPTSVPSSSPSVLPSFGPSELPSFTPSANPTHVCLRKLPIRQTDSPYMNRDKFPLKKNWAAQKSVLSRESWHFVLTPELVCACLVVVATNILSNAKYHRFVPTEHVHPSIKAVSLRQCPSVSTETQGTNVLKNWNLMKVCNQIVAVWTEYCFLCCALCIEFNATLNETSVVVPSSINDNGIEVRLKIIPVKAVSQTSVTIPSTGRVTTPILLAAIGLSCRFVSENEPKAFTPLKRYKRDRCVE